MFEGIGRVLRKHVRGEKPLGELWAAYKAVRAVSVRERTAEMDAYGYWALEAMGVEYPSQITLEKVDAYAMDRRAAGTSARTVNIQLTRIRKMLAFGVKRGYCRTNPLADWEQLLEEETYPPRALSRLEVGALLKTAPECYRRMFIAYLCTGMRVSELLKLTWGQVDLERSIIELPPAMVKTKTPRYVFLGARITGLLRELGPGEAGDPVFPNQKGGAHRRKSFRHRVAYWAKKAGIAGRVTAKDFRSSCVTFCSAAGLTYAMTQKLVGHNAKSGKLTLDRYFIPSQGRQHEAAGLVEDLVFACMD